MQSFPLRLTLLSCALLAIAGCAQQSDEQVLENAQNCYQIISLRYEQLLDLTDNDELMQASRTLGTVTRPQKSWFDWLWQDSHYKQEASPLHALTRCIENDLDNINYHIGLLQNRLLITIPLVTRLKECNNCLLSVLQIIKADHDYAEESRFLELARLEQNRLDETVKQRELLAKIAYSRPVVVEKKKVLHKREFGEIEVC